MYVLNRSSTKSLGGKTPYEAWFGQKPQIDHLRVFRSLVYVKKVSGHLKKSESRSQPIVFIGYETGIKAYKCFIPKDSTIQVSRDVIFKEEKEWDWKTSPRANATE